MGKHSVACTSCAPLANKWLEQHGQLPPAESPAGEPKPEPEPA